MESTKSFSKKETKKRRRDDWKILGKLNTTKSTQKSTVLMYKNNQPRHLSPHFSQI